MVKSTNSEARMPGFQPGLSPVAAAEAWTSELGSLYLSVSICKMKNSLVLASKRFQGLIGECDIKHCPTHSMRIVSFLTIMACLGETAGLASDHPSKRIS